MTAAPFDSATLEVLWTRLVSIVDEAAAALVRTSFSTVVRDSHDFSCVITDAAGRSLVQATDSIPSFIGTLPRTIRHFLDEFPAESLQPGDVLITNDIWMGTGHLPDISVGKPLFFNGEIVGFAGSTAHAPDIGGKIRSPEPREVFEEGFQIPIMKVIRAGEPDETFFNLLRKNVRAPDEVVGDLWAQITALDLMDNRTDTFMREYGLDTLEDLATEIQSRSERAMRAAITALPDGTYGNTISTDGLTEPLDLKVKLTINDDGRGIDPEKIKIKALNSGVISQKEFENIETIKPEVYFNKETRFDFLIKQKSQKIFIEVKNVTLFRNKKIAEFPDAITTRGSKHLITLIDATKKGYKCFILFLVQIQNIENFKIARDIDNEHYENYIAAKKAGVNFLAYRCKISSKKIFIDKKIKIIND